MAKNCALRIIPRFYFALGVVFGLHEVVAVLEGLKEVVADEGGIVAKDCLKHFLGDVRTGEEVFLEL